MSQECIYSPPKRLAVFIHGFGSSSGCWDNLIKLLADDPTVSNKIELIRFEYPTKWFNASVHKRIPKLQEIACLLADFLVKRSSDYNDITLVGHSQGGLVVQSYLAKTLQDGRGQELDRIRQVILVATPNFGSKWMGLVRYLVFSLLKNPQEKSLRVLDEEIQGVLQEVNKRVINATHRNDTEWPIPVRCFWGLEDQIVPKSSAQGLYFEGSSLHGDHFTILNPTSRNDQRYESYYDALLTPIGHRNFHEVDLYEQDIRVKPLPEDFQERVTFGSLNEKQRVITCDNIAHVIRKIRFSRFNRCSNLYSLAYRTRNQGFIRGRPSHPNEANAIDFGRYNEYGTEYTFKFTPKPGEQYVLDLDVYKGFDIGNRNLHFHLNSQTHYRKIRVKLDLSPYIKAGFKLSSKPELRFYPQEDARCDLIPNLPYKGPFECSSSDKETFWEWELFDLWQGGVSIQWDVSNEYN